MPVLMQPSFLDLPNNRRIAYHLTEGALPGVMFMGGFKSNMSGGKATALEAFCKERGQRFLRFDYTGHGHSSGAFREGTIGAWKQDVFDVFDALGAKQNILVGSSMGAWMALMLALARKDRVAGLLGIASAPDFTQRLIWQRMTPEQKSQLSEKGVFYAPSCYGEDPYPISRMLIEESRHHLLLHADIEIDVPVRLIHGTKDQDVPWHMSVSLMDGLRSRDARLHLIKDGDHRLSSPEHLAFMCEVLGGLL
jgi:pimeloyl-ACP methyl ester carboxylesterase